MRLAVPTREELSDAFSVGREIVACSGQRYGPLIAVSIACRNGDTAILSLNEFGALCLFDVLKVLFPAIQGAPASPATVHETATGVEVQAGHISE